MQNNVPLANLRPSTVSALRQRADGEQIKKSVWNTLLTRDLIDVQGKATITGQAVLAMHDLTPDARQILIRLIRNGSEGKRLSILSVMTWSVIEDYQDALLSLVNRRAVDLIDGLVYLAIPDAVVQEMKRIYPVALADRSD